MLAAGISGTADGNFMRRIVPRAHGLDTQEIGDYIIVFVGSVNPVSMKAIWRLVVCLVCLALGGAAWGAGEDVSTIAQATDEHYNRLKSFKADFTEIYQSPGVSRTESGTLWLKKPGRMRWEYSQPREKLFLTDAKTAY